MEKRRRDGGGPLGTWQIRIKDPAMTVECLGMEHPVGTVMAWSERPEFIAVKYPAMMVVYEVVRYLRTETTDDGFSEVSTLEVQERLAFPHRVGCFK